MAIQGQGSNAPTKRTPGEQPQDELEQLLQFFKKYGASIVLVLMIIAVGVSGFVLYKNYTQNMENRACALFSKARDNKQMEEVVKNYPNALIAPLAHKFLATQYYREGKYEKALEEYTSFIIQHPKHQVVPDAVIGKAYSLEALGEIESAQEIFSKFSTDYPDHYLVPLSILGVARCLEQLKKYSESKIIYEDFVVQYVESLWAGRAEERLKDISRHLE